LWGFPAVGTVLGYVFYWLAVIVALVVMKFLEVSLLLDADLSNLLVDPDFVGAY